MKCGNLKVESVDEVKLGNGITPKITPKIPTLPTTNVPLAAPTLDPARTASWLI